MNKHRTTPYIDDIVDRYIKKTKEFYPCFEFGSRRSMYSGDQPYSCTFEFRLKSTNLANTEYQVKRNYNLIHYSNSIQNIIEILNSGFFRLSNVVALNDPQEINFITNNLEMKFDKDQIKDYKNNYFVGSFCKVTNIKKPDEFSMWRLYGNDGFGAAIVFEIKNPVEEWSNFLLGNMQYGDCESVKLFKSFFDFHNAFQKENDHAIQNLPLAFSTLMALHKNNIWRHEKEVRLLTHQPYDKYSLKEAESHICNLKHAISKNGTKHAYIEVPLFNSKEYRRIEKIIPYETLKRLIPIIKIKKIILGYRHGYDAFDNVRDIVGSAIDICYQHPISVERSHLIKQMV